VLAVVNQHGRALYFASAHLQADREIVLVAVNNRGFALLYPSKDLKADIEIVLAAVNRSGSYALKYASLELQDDVYLQRLPKQIDLASLHPIRAAFLRYARDLREAKRNARIDPWLTIHDDGVLSHLVDATHPISKARKRARTK
jgi:hypothetical protein